MSIHKKKNRHNSGQRNRSLILRKNHMDNWTYASSSIHYCIEEKVEQKRDKGKKCEIYCTRNVHALTRYDHGSNYQ